MILSFEHSFMNLIYIKSHYNSIGYISWIFSVLELSDTEFYLR